MSFIILDRDGVINYDSIHYIKSPDEWLPIPGSLEAIAQLNRHGYRVLIATNQSGIARGFYDIDTLDAIHEKLTRELAAVGGYVEEIFFCPHHPDDHCECRKPNPGMLHAIAEKYAVNLEKTHFIGDSHVDIQAANAAGCQPILILSDKGLLAQARYPEMKEVPCFDSLAKAVDYILAKREVKNV